MDLKRFFSLLVRVSPLFLCLLVYPSCGKVKETVLSHSWPAGAELPDVLEGVAFGLPREMVHARLPHKDFKETECDNSYLPSADLCEKVTPHPENIIGITFQYNKNRLVHVSISGDMSMQGQEWPSSESPELTVTPAGGGGDFGDAYRHFQGLGEPSLFAIEKRGDDDGDAVAASHVLWEVGGWQFRLLYRVIDMSTVVGDKFNPRLACGSFWQMDFLVPGSPKLDLPHKTVSTVTEAAEHVSSFGRMCRFKALIKAMFDDGTVSKDDCLLLSLLRDVPVPVCEALGQIVDDGRSTPRLRKTIEEFIRGRGYFNFTGYVIGLIDDSVYEVARLTRDYWGNQVPVRGERYLLVTTLTDYSTTGRFNLWVRRGKSQQVTLKRGGVDTVPVLIEDKLGTAVKQIYAARAGRPTSAAALGVLRALKEGDLK